MTVSDAIDGSARRHQVSGLPCAPRGSGSGFGSSALGLLGMGMGAEYSYLFRLRSRSANGWSGWSTASEPLRASETAEVEQAGGIDRGSQSDHAHIVEMQQQQHQQGQWALMAAANANVRANGGRGRQEVVDKCRLSSTVIGDVIVGVRGWHITASSPGNGAKEIEGVSSVDLLDLEKC